MDWIDEVVRDVAELDYNSPVDQPSLMIVKAGELRAIVEARSDTEIARLRAALQRVKLEAASLADAQVIALEALGPNDQVKPGRSASA